MRRSLLSTTAIAALALAPALAFAQVQSNGPSGAIQEQPPNQEHKAPKAAKPVTPAPGTTAPGKSAQTQTPPTTQQPQEPQGLQGQAQPQPPKEKQRLQGQAQQRTITGAQQRPTGTAGAPGGARGQIQVTEQQRTQIRERISHVKVERIEHPRFSVRVGAEIPRSVHVEVLPPEIVEIVPEYQGFDFVMVGDEILIVDPGSRQMVAVIPA